MPALTEGKTKAGYSVSAIEFFANEFVTALDGERRDVLPGKGLLATETTVNVFELLNYCGIPTAYIGRTGPDSFLAYACDMIQIEVVGRVAVAEKGSYRSRHPDAAVDSRFDQPVIEMYLKTKDKKLREKELPCDDPLMKINGKYANLYRPKDIASVAQPFIIGWPLAAHGFPVGTELDDIARLLEEMAQITARVARILDLAWHRLGCTFYDFKLEFGLYRDSKTGKLRLLVADVIDADSMRLLDPGGRMASKQGYRNGDDLDAVLQAYKRAEHQSKRLKSVRSSVRETVSEDPNANSYIDGYR